MATVAKKPVFRVIERAQVSRRERDPSRPIIVGIHPDGALTFRLKGTREVLEMHVFHAYELARRAAIRAVRARRKSAREKRRLEAMLARAHDRDHPLNREDAPACPPGAKVGRKRATKRKARRSSKRRTRRTAR